MSLELDTLNIQINEPLKAANIRTVVDTDVIVPDSKPDVLNVLQVNAISSVTEKYIQKDHVTVSGVIDYTILYSGDEEQIHVKSINFKTPFSQQIEVEGVEDNMFNYVKSDVRHIEYHIQNSRKINVKSVVSLETNIIRSGVAPVVAGISSSSSIPVKNEVIKAFNLAVCCENNFDIEDNLRVPGSNPNIDDILKSDIRLESGELKVVNNKVIAKGSAVVNTLYTCDDDIYYMENEIPFTEVIDVDGITPDMHSDIDYDITGAAYEVESDENGDKNGVYVKISISCLVRAYEDEQYDVVADVYSPDYEVNVQRKSINVSEIIDTSNSTCAINDSIEVSSAMPPMTKIYNFISSPYIENSYIEGTTAVVEGFVNAQILYLSDSEASPVYCAKKNIPFVHRTEISKSVPGATVSATVHEEHGSYSFKSPSEADVRISLRLNVNVIKNQQTDVITDVEVNEDLPIDKSSQPGIVIYFAEESDTLWDIAKRYHTTTAEIAQVNKIDEDEQLKNRQQLLIPKRRVDKI